MNAVPDLLFDGQPGWPHGVHHAHHDHLPNGCDPLRYVWWVDPGRTPPFDYQGRRRIPELAPRTALHLVVCRNGGHS